MIRYSNKDDYNQITKLLYKCFGVMVQQEGAFDDIENGRYLCYLEGNKIVAVTGLRQTYQYKGSLEVTWTCTDPEYRHKGYMQELFARMLSTTDEVVYCSCWKIGSNDVNLRSLMELNGFIRIVKDQYTRDVRYNCDKVKDCPYREEACFCGNDLYIRTKTK